MKTFKKFAALLIAALMVLAMAVPAMADGTDGKITLDNATVGVTYKAYKILDATLGEGGAIAYTTKTPANFTGSPFTVSNTADSNGNYAVTVAENTEAATITGWIKSNLTKFTALSANTGVDGSDKATANKVEWTGLPYGYYYVTSGLGSEVTVDSANPEVTIKDKNTQKPDGPDKVINSEVGGKAGVDATGLNTTSNDAAVGSKQSFTVTFTATNWETETNGDGEIVSKYVKNFTIEDQPRNMTIDPSTVNLVIGDAKGDVAVITNGSATSAVQTFTVASGDAGKLTIVLKWVDDNNNSLYNAADGQSAIPVTLTYQAWILESAATQNADNTVSVNYDRVGSSGTENAPLGDSETQTKTYKFAVEKTDKSGNGLTGATFQLKLNGTVVNVVEDGTNTFRVANSTETGNSTFTMASDTVTLIGLDLTDYTLTEIEAPKGYNLLTSDVQVGSGKLVDASGNIGEPQTVTVINNSGTELPSTGGMGTTIFYAVGSLFVLGGVVVLIARRKVRG